MITKDSYVDLETPTVPMRTHVIEPADPTAYRQKPFGGLIFYSEIFQVTEPVKRLARHFAGQGYVVMIPEIYHDNLPPGTELGYDDDGKTTGNDLKKATKVSSFDNGVEAMVQALRKWPNSSGRVGAAGVCIGGHLAIRAALHPEILASASFFPTDVHSGTLGEGENADTLQRMSEIKGELMLVFGRQDPHVPDEGRLLLYKALQASGICYTWHEFNAQHAFLRDEGYRFDPGLAHLCRELAFDMFHRTI